MIKALRTEITASPWMRAALRSGRLAESHEATAKVNEINRQILGNRFIDTAGYAA
ncbi:MAG: hypothetical protein PF480_06615 [Roseovarius sp.]|nr:hypothetical protein [Roseovarius sp.]